MSALNAINLIMVVEKLAIKLVTIMPISKKKNSFAVNVPPSP
jgi:hypothetical protein